MQITIAMYHVPDIAPIDVEAISSPSFIYIYATTQAGADWLLANVEGTNGDAYVCEHRYGPDILLGAHNAGLTVSLDGVTADVERRAAA